MWSNLIGAKYVKNKPSLLIYCWFIIICLLFKLKIELFIIDVIVWSQFFHCLNVLVLVQIWSRLLPYLPFDLERLLYLVEICTLLYFIHASQIYICFIVELLVLHLAFLVLFTATFLRSSFQLFLILFVVKIMDLLTSGVKNQLIACGYLFVIAENVWRLANHTCIIIIDKIEIKAHICDSIVYILVKSIVNAHLATVVCDRIVRHLVKFINLKKIILRHFALKSLVAFYFDQIIGFDEIWHFLKISRFLFLNFDLLVF